MVILKQIRRSLFLAGMLFCGTLLARTEENHPGELPPEEIAEIASPDLATLFKFLIMDDHSKAPRQMTKRDRQAHGRQPSLFGQFKVTTEIAGMKFFLIRVFDKGSQPRGFENALNARRPFDVQTATRILRILRKREDAESREVLMSLLNIPESQLLQFAFYLPGRSEMVSVWNDFNSEIKYIGLSVRMENQEPIAQGIIRASQTTLDQGKARFQKHAEKFRAEVRAALSKQVGFFWNRRPMFDPEVFKESVIQYQNDIDGSVPSEVKNTADSLHLALGLYLRSTRLFKDPLEIVRLDPIQRGEKMYNALITGLAIDGHPFFDSGMVLTVDDLAQKVAINSASREDMARLCALNIARLVKKAD